MAGPALNILVILLVLAGLGHSVPGKIPPEFKVCRQTDPYLNDCLREAITIALPIVGKGVPSLGMLPIDPLEITTLAVNEGHGPVNVNLEFNNIKLLGLSTGHCETVTMDPKKFVLDGTLHFDSPIRLQGPYKVNGRILVLPIAGNGNCNLTLTDLVATIHVEGDPYTKGGETYMKIKTFDVKFETSRLHIHLENLFGGDQALGDNMNIFLNDNWHDILKEIKPAIEAALGASFQHITGRFFQKVPYNQAFPEK